MQKIINFFEKTSVLNLLTILFLLTFAIYINTLPNKLFFDDEQFIYKNGYITSFSYLPKFFSENLLSGSGTNSNYYRPFLLISFALDYAFFGMSPFAFHLTNVLLHIASAISIFFLINKLFKDRVIAFSSSLLFAIHPIQTESVAYASSRGDSLSIFFIVLSLLFILNKSFKKYSLSLFFFTLALLSKEVAIITPGLVVLVLLIHRHAFTKKVIKQIIFLSLPFFTISLIYLLLRLTVLNFNNTLNFYGGDNLYTENVLVRLNTFVNYIPQYFSLLLFPKTLIYDRTTQIFPNLTLISIIVLLLFSGSAFLSIEYFKKFPIIFFSLFWFFISFIPMSGIIPINSIFFEHFLYLPSVGFFALFSFSIVYLIKHSKKPFTVLVSCVFLFYLFFLGTKTISRNSDWRDPITFYEKTLRYTENARLHNNLAMAYGEKGEIEKAIVEYKKSIQLGDVYPQVHYNLGNTYKNLGDLKEAETEYKKAISLDPYFYLAQIKLFELYKITNNMKGQEDIIAQLEKLAESDPEYQKLIDSLQKN